MLNRGQVLRDRLHNANRILNFVLVHLLKVIHLTGSFQVCICESNLYINKAKC